MRNYTGSVCSSRSSRWKVSVPAALVIGGIALSCSTACLTSAVVSEVRGDAATARREKETARDRAAIAALLRPLLPTAGTGVTEAERLEVSGNNYGYVVVAVGVFSAVSASEFATAARRLYAETILFHTPLTVRVYQSGQAPRSILGEFTINLVREAETELRKALPPASVKTRPTERLWVTHDGGRVLYVTVIGVFAPGEAEAFELAVTMLHAGLPQPPKFVVSLFRETDESATRQLVKRFDVETRSPTKL